MRIILASSSPRRLQLLRQVGLDPEVAFPEVEENMADGETVDRYIRRITQAKLEAVLTRENRDALMIAADTVVLLGNEVIGKPEDREDARAILQRLSGRAHDVRTGVYLRRADSDRYEVSQTRVYFHRLTDHQISRYISCESIMDKAGAYGIQGLAALFVEKVEGCYFNVVGFPLSLLFGLTAGMGIDLLDLCTAMDP